MAGQIRALWDVGVLLLKKVVHGLKQAPRVWWKKLHAFLASLGFRANKSDPCFYALNLTGGAVVLLLLYVDDIILAASTAELVSHYAMLISKTFRVSSDGPLTTYLGIDIKIDRVSRKVELCMAKFIKKVFSRFKLTAMHSGSVPLREGIMGALEGAPLADDVFAADFQFREKVGCIMYYMVCKRPDVCFAVGLMARYADKVSRVAAAGVTRLL